MNANRNNYYYRNDRDRHIPNYRRESYVDGNTVRRINVQPDRIPQGRPERTTRRRHQQAPVSMPGISGASFAFMLTALAAVIVVGFLYITTQNQVREMKNEIVSLQTEISDTKIDNEERYENILATVDLAEVYEIATEKLNMVRAENNQIYTYKNKKGDMVKQYAEVKDVD